MRKLSPYIIIVLSFIFLILIGTLLLMLPFSTESNNLRSIDSLFLSTSAVTITGLSPIADLASNLTTFGKFVLAILIQIGGLSIVTLSVFIMLLIGSKIGITNRVLIKESLNQNNLSGMVRLVKKIVLTTLVIEFIGFIINLFVFIPRFEIPQAIGLSAFYAISSFNNAGFVLLGDNSIINYVNSSLLNFNMAVMIMLGSLGFIVIHDIIEKRSYKKLTIHSKIVLTMNFVLWVTGFIVFRFSKFESGNLRNMDALFLSISARTAGFETISLSNLTTFMTFILIILMFIGGSPSSTSGGIKVTTAYVGIKSLTSYAKGKQTITHKRLINDETKQKAFTLIFTALIIILIGTSIILYFDDYGLDKVLFEVVSAFSNVGFTIDLTPKLKGISKLVLVLVMFIGRVGPLTIISLFNKNWYKKGYSNVGYIEERISIG